MILCSSKILILPQNAATVQNKAPWFQKMVLVLGWAIDYIILPSMKAKKEMKAMG